MKSKLVALHMGLHTNHRLEMAQGIVQYAREHPSWRLYGSFYTSQPVKDYKKWDGDGIISICHRREEAEEILATGLPIVDLVEGFFDRRIVNVTSDNLEAGRMAGKHLLMTQFTHFAYCDIRGLRWSRLRAESFAETVGMDLRDMPVFSRVLHWWQNPWRSKSLVTFLAGLPGHTAILAGNDTAGVKVTAACQACGRVVPDDLAVMGIEGDNLLCELSHPPLSTIHIDGIGIGYAAAKRLDEMMCRKAYSRVSVHIPPGKLKIRASTDTLACDDEVVRKAALYIRKNCGRTISVSDVVREAAVCRRTLEMKFRRHMGRTIYEEIRLNRMRMARQLLEETDLSVNTVLLKCGFMSHQYFYAAFQKETALTPARYRARHRRKYTTRPVMDRT